MRQGGGLAMRDVKQREQLSLLVEQRRRELLERPDVSERTRELSQSSSRNAIYPQVKRRTLVTMVAAALGMIALIALVVTAVAITAGGIWFQNQLNDPSVTVQKFYSALHQQQYTEAYSYLSPNLQHQISKAKFTTEFSSDDAINGVVESYPTTNAVTSDSAATITVDLVRRGNDTSAQQVTLHLVKSGNNWLIDNISIVGNVPIPTTTAGND